MNDGGYAKVFAAVVLGKNDDWIFDVLIEDNPYKNRKMFDHQMNIIRERLFDLRDELE